MYDFEQPYDFLYCLVDIKSWDSLINLTLLSGPRIQFVSGVRNVCDMENGGKYSPKNEYYEPIPKKIKSEWCKSYSEKAVEMMCKMGYVSDKGLGKKGQGRLEPVEAFHQEGRRGLGLKCDITAPQQWNENCEELLVPEPISWLRNSDTVCYSLDEMLQWIHWGPSKDSLDDETIFCDSQILKNVLNCKTALNDFNSADIRKARTRCNPFETIRNAIFQNRAAVKMANLDSLCEFMFTNPRDKLGNSLLSEDDLLYFADICAGPGGFSEYILYRKSWEAKGFGFTLRGANDFKLEKFFAASPESFDAFYGIQEDGNIFYENNQKSLAEYIFKHCKQGVHFVMADGGFSVDGQENIQEILSKQLYLCQCLTALLIVREKGHFVCKLFDTFTHFSVGLLYLMYLCFDEISICKPNSSRPANSERYLICKWKKPNTDDVQRYLNEINLKINQRGPDDNDITEIVSYDVLMTSESFLKYIMDSNNLIGGGQIIALKKIVNFCQNPLLKESRQPEIRKKCLDLWNLPDKLRQAPEMGKSTEKVLEEILDNWYSNKAFLNAAPIELTSELLQKYIESVHDWYFIPIGRRETSVNECSIFLCRNRGSLLKYSGNNKWEPMEYMFEISPKSLFYGEIVYEYNGEGRTQTRVCGLHIIDAIMLGGKDVRRLRLKDRIKMCSKFATSLNKPHKSGGSKISAIRCKQLHGLKDLTSFFNNMKQHNLKDNSSRLGFVLDSDGFKQKFFVPGGLILFCEINNNFFSKISQTTNLLYYFNKATNCSYYLHNMPPDIRNNIFASFRNSFCRRLVWKWTNTAQVEERSSNKETCLLYREDITNFISKKF